MGSALLLPYASNLEGNRVADFLLQLFHWFRGIAEVSILNPPTQWGFIPNFVKWNEPAKNELVRILPENTLVFISMNTFGILIDNEYMFPFTKDVAGHADRSPDAPIPPLG